MLNHVCTLGLAALLLLSAQDAAGQGRGRPKQPQATVQPVASPASAPASVDERARSGLLAMRQFGSWLDDASGVAAGSGSTGISAGYWRVAGGSQVDVPIVDVAYGVTNRLQVGATVPFYMSRYQGATAHGLDDMYVSAKVVARDAAAAGRRVGVAVSPLLEILSTGPIDGRRVHWAVPVSVEVRGEAIRMYGSAGYFSRGALFTGAAVEWRTPAGTLLTGALTQSLSTADAGADVGAGRQRVDATIAIAHALTNVAAAYVSAGRSLTSVDQGGSSLSVGGGVSFRFAR